MRNYRRFCHHGRQLAALAVAGVLGASLPADVLLAQDSQPGDAPPETPAADLLDQYCQPTRAHPRVLEARVVETRNAAPDDVERVVEQGTQKVKLRDTLTVKLQNLSTLRAQLDCLSNQDPGNARRIVLFLDGRPLDVAAYPPTNPQSETLRFPLLRTETSRDVWRYVLGKPRFSPRPTEVSVGIDDGAALEPGVTVLFEVLPWRWLVFWGASFVFLAVIFLWLAISSDLLRDTSRPHSTEARRLFSLARTQAAVWFFLILGSYLFIGLVTGDYSTSITGTVLALLGISAGTTVASALVDANKAESDDAALRAAKLDATESAIQQISSELAQAKQAYAKAHGASETQAAASQLTRLEADKRAKTSDAQCLRFESQGFLTDILSDAKGINFHRFQIAAWTVVLGIVFIVEVYRELAMPQFSETLLMLMGISSGTYVGLKIPEATMTT